jgi:hypothetical protein
VLEAILYIDANYLELMPIYKNFPSVKKHLRHAFPFMAIMVRRKHKPRRGM